MYEFCIFQENNDLKSKNRTLSAQLREIEVALTQRLAGKSEETDVKYVDCTSERKQRA